MSYELVSAIGKIPMPNPEHPLCIMILVDILDAMGGAERNIYMLTRGLSQRGHRVIVCPLKGGVVSRKMKEEGFDVRELNIFKIYNLKGLKAISHLLATIHRERVTNLLTYHDSADFIGVALSRLSATPIVSTRRDTGFKLKKRHIYVYRVINRFFNHILANSPAVKMAIVEGQKSNDEIVSIIHNGVEIAPEIQGRKWVLNGVDDIPGTIYICCVANIRPIKGIATLIDAAALVLKKHPKARFFLIGSKKGDGDYYQELIRKIENLGIGDAIFFTGSIPFQRVPAALSSMDISVLPSLSEGLSNTLLESMASGKPVLATNVGGNPELVVHGDTGFLVPPEAPAKMAEALERLISDPDLRRRMGSRARYRAEHEFGIEKMLDKTEAVLKRVWSQ